MVLIGTYCKKNVPDLIPERHLLNQINLMFIDPLLLNKLYWLKQL